nr:hypothetical protein [Tanacetum cinerariifolium]
MLGSCKKSKKIEALKGCLFVETKGEEGEENSVENNKVVNKNVVEPSELDVVEPIELVDRKEGMEDETDDESDENFVILDIEEDENNPFILGTPFLTTCKAKIRFDKGIITLNLAENSIENNKVVDKNVVEPSELDVVEPIELVDRKEGMEDGTDDESDESMKEELTE